VFQKLRWSLSYCPSKSIAVDKQADDKVVHLYRFGVCVAAERKTGKLDFDVGVYTEYVSEPATSNARVKWNA